MEAIVQVLSSKRKCRLIFIHSFSIHWETLLEKIYWEAYRIPWRNETHSDLFSNSHGRVFILCTNQIGLSYSAESILYRQVRHSWVHTGKFAILEFTPASSPFLSSHRQVSHYCSHRQVSHYCSHRQVSHYCSYRQDSPSLSSYRQGSPSFSVHIGKIRQVLS